MGGGGPNWFYGPRVRKEKGRFGKNWPVIPFDRAIWCFKILVFSYLCRMNRTLHSLYIGGKGEGGKGGSNFELWINCTTKAIWLRNICLALLQDAKLDGYKISHVSVTGSLVTSSRKTHRKYLTPCFCKENSRNIEQKNPS